MDGWGLGAGVGAIVMPAQAIQLKMRRVRVVYVHVTDTSGNRIEGGRAGPPHVYTYHENTQLEHKRTHRRCPRYIICCWWARNAMMARYMQVPCHRVAYSKYSRQLSYQVRYKQFKQRSCFLLSATFAIGKLPTSLILTIYCTQSFSYLIKLNTYTVEAGPYSR